MSVKEQQDLPVYLFTGFLESGKTKFIKESLADPKFNEGEKTLLIVCEEGLEEYEPDAPYMANVTVETFDDPEQLTEERLRARVLRSGAERVVVEYNGMWQLGDFFEAMPANWDIYQLMFFADATTIINYNANMRQLVAEKLQACDLAVFNRVTPDSDTEQLHKLVRGLSRGAGIIYEYRDGSIVYDEEEDPLPFDINADIIEIEDRDYALFFRDISEDFEKYEGKTVRFTGIIAKDDQIPKNMFVIGRHIMTCCEADIAYSGFAAVWQGAEELKSYDWRKMTARIAIEKCKIYRQKGPVFYPISVEECEAPEQKVATFY
ncbi:MAG: GTPase [Clostridia bacterium]|nr:GTPase [Clostridia bacterium]